MVIKLNLALGRFFQKSEKMSVNKRKFIHAVFIYPPVHF